MNKQTIINRYFANCEKLHQTWCELPTDVRNFIINEGVSSHDNEQNQIALNHFKQSIKYLANTDYNGCNVKAGSLHLAFSVKSFVSYKLYSYGSHFPIVIFDVMTNTYYLNYTRYSSSTGSHQSAAFRSVPDRANVVYCDFVGGNGHGYSLPLIGYKNDSGDMCYKIDDDRCFSSFEALLAHRKETEKVRKFELAADKYFRTFSDDFMNAINPLIGNNANSGDFSQVKKLLKKWINQTKFVKYGTFERVSRYKYFIDRLESAHLWDWFIKETNKSIRKYADGLQVA